MQKNSCPWPWLLYVLTYRPLQDNITTILCTYNETLLISTTSVRDDKQVVYRCDTKNFLTSRGTKLHCTLNHYIHALYYYLAGKSGPSLRMFIKSYHTEVPSTTYIVSLIEDQSLTDGGNWLYWLINSSLESLHKISIFQPQKALSMWYNPPCLRFADRACGYLTK